MPTPLLPESPAPVSYEIRSKTNTVRSESLSGKILTRKVGGQRFEMTLVYPPMQKTDFGEIIAFLNEQDGMNGIFYVRIPTLSGSEGSAGEYVNYDNHTKLYQVASNGVDTVPDTLVTGGNVVTNAVYMRASLANDIQTVNYNPDGTVRIEIDLVERI